MRKRGGFTLIELMAVIAIIAMLATMMLPQVSKFQERTQSVVCMNNLRQIGIGVLGYVGDNNTEYPIVEPDPAAASKLYADMFGPESVRDIEGGKRVVVGNSHFDIVTEAELEAQVGDAAPDPQGRKAYMAGLTFRTVSVQKAARALQEGKIEGVVESAGRLVVPAKQAVNAVLEFVE